LTPPEEIPARELKLEAYENETKSQRENSNFVREEYVSDCPRVFLRLPTTTTTIPK
jgi:hypothetical protein